MTARFIDLGGGRLVNVDHIVGIRSSDQARPDGRRHTEQVVQLSDGSEVVSATLSVEQLRYGTVPAAPGYFAVHRWDGGWVDRAPVVAWLIDAGEVAAAVALDWPCDREARTILVPDGRVLDLGSAEFPTYDSWLDSRSMPTDSEHPL